MSGLRLQLRGAPQGDWDAAALGGDLPEMSADSASRLRLRCLGSNASLAVGDCFAVSSRTDGRVVIEGDLPCFHRLGEGWRGGQLIVEGNVGDGFASQMRGGQVSLNGNASAGAAEQMRGGDLRISGDVGHSVGRPLPGRRSGMSGGRVVVAGRGGHCAGERMRRGTLLILGGCGDCLGCDMVAGTIVVAGSVGEHVAAGMRRGTLLVADSVQLSPLRFSEPRIESLGIMRLLRADLLPDAVDIAAALEGSIARAVGDLSAGGMGEIWLYRR